MTRIPGEPLGLMMEDLDGTCFSHSGIAVHCRHGSRCRRCRPRIASALMKGLPDAADWGGIRYDDFTEYWPSRDLYCIPMEPEEQHRALAAVAEFPAEPGEDGRFAITKLVAIAVALRAQKLKRCAATRDLGERLFVAARAVAKSWEATPKAPSYYCAEFVAACYDRPFTRGDLEPPDPDDVDGAGDRGSAPRETWAAVRELLEGELWPDREQRRTRHRMLALLWQEDPVFLRLAVRTVLAAAVFAATDDDGPAVDRPPPAVPTPLDLDEPVTDPDSLGEDIPFGLVTPRMLWAAFGRHTMYRVAQPCRS